MNLIEITGVVLLIGVGLLLVGGVVRSKLNSGKNTFPPPKFNIGSFVQAASGQSSPFKARIATRNWHYAEQSYIYVLEGKSKNYLENELKSELDPALKRIAKAPDESHQRILDAGMAEYAAKGTVSNSHCEICHSLLRIRKLGESAWSVECNCGKFNDTLRGI